MRIAWKCNYCIFRLHLLNLKVQRPTPPGRVSNYCSATLAFTTSVNKKSSCFSKLFRLTHYIRSTASLSHSAFVCVRHGFHLCHWFSCSFACSATLDCFKLPFAPCFPSRLWFVIKPFTYSLLISIHFF